MVLLGTSSPIYRVGFHSHKASCLCKANSEGQVLVSLFRTYRKLSRGKCTPNHCRLPNMGWGRSPSGCKLQSTLRLEYFRRGLSRPDWLCPKEWLLAIRFPVGPPGQWVSWWRLEYRSRQSARLLLVVFLKCRLRDRYFCRIWSIRWACRWWRRRRALRSWLRQRSILHSTCRFVFFGCRFRASCVLCFRRTSCRGWSWSRCGLRSCQAWLKSQRIGAYQELSGCYSISWMSARCTPWSARTHTWTLSKDLITFGQLSCLSQFIQKQHFYWLKYYEMVCG